MRAQHRMAQRWGTGCGWLLVVLFAARLVAAADTAVDAMLKQIGTERGVTVVIGLPAAGSEALVGLVQSSELTVYFQSSDAAQVASVRAAAESAGLLGRRLFVDAGDPRSIQMVDNLADAILVAPGAADQVTDAELLRVLAPRATAFVGGRRLTKPVPEGIDEWSHPYHGPDNNPQSNDQLVRGRFRTQFISDPKFSPMPEQTVVAGGRIFKAMGHIAHKANQNAMLNTLLCVNAYNGTILWKRPLSPGFMIHRNTMIATADALFMGDHESCKVIDARTGKVRREITVSEKLTDGPVWKWMGLQGNVLYALVGNPEVKVETLRSVKRGLGHWPWGMWKGHDYKDLRTAFGFGRTLVAVDPKSGKLLWHYRDEEFLDARAVCLKNNRLYCFCAEKFLACIDATNGKLLWKNSDKDLLAAVGPNFKAQHYITGYATTCYMKCDTERVFFAGPQRTKLVVASATDGHLIWSHPVGNLQLVLRKDAIYAAGPQKTNGSRLDYQTGKVLSTFPARRACTRATGCADSIFYRASGGTVRVMTETNTATHIAPMRPPCQDGVIVSNGHLYWGPWMCGCQLSLYGNIALSAVGSAADRPVNESDLHRGALVVHADTAQVRPLGARPGDWTSYRADKERSDATSVRLPGDVQLDWTADICAGELPTAPVAAGGLVFVADRTGAVRALDATGKLVWKRHTGGPIYYPPTIAQDRLYVGSADGRVYAFEAVSGRPLWTYRVAPRDRRILVFGKLVSPWPVAGGVVVDRQTVYAAAGITHYDGTYVVALDALTGKLKAFNNTSGTLSEQVDSGISLQGTLKVIDGELRFLGGGVYETARYDLKTLKCLNTPKDQVTSQFRTAFYPYYPSYGKYVSLEHVCSDGNTLCYDAAYEGSNFSKLALETPLPAGAAKRKKDAAREFLRRSGRKVPDSVWRDGSDRRFTSFVVAGDRLLAAGHPDKDPRAAFLMALRVQDGTQQWLHKLPADAVKAGIAVDHSGRVFVAVENGQLLCFRSAQE